MRDQHRRLPDGPAVAATGMAVYVVASIGVALAKRQASMSEMVRWLAVVVFATGLLVAFVIRYLQAGLTEPERGLCLLAVLLGFGLPFWDVSKGNKSRSK